MTEKISNFSNKSGEISCIYIEIVNVIRHTFFVCYFIVVVIINVQAKQISDSKFNMAKVISQETFDDAVRENVIEFEMNIPDAKEETVQQFEAQGINLANIIKDLAINEETGKPVLNETIDKLKTIIAKKDIVDADELPKLLDTIANECVASVPHRVVS